ncbi:MAG TPA: hypothetical protein VLD19_17190, partial [Chitinophagaceae bacterium]|nr:hypothetical protein [Chitinophagaceae bacterium]
MYRIPGCWLFLLLLAGSRLYAQQADLPAWQPTRAEEIKRYKQALLIDSAVKNTVYKAGVLATWQPGGEKCWYRNTGKDSTQEYIYVDAAHARRQPA